MAELVGKKLKDFYILRRLGRGAMAEVYLAQQLSLGRQVALKVLNAGLATDPTYVRRFHHEARAAAALVHAGIVQIYEVGQEDGIHYIAQEYVPGRNLGEVIRSQGSLTPRLTLDILRQVTGALCKASGEGIVHRDIKPENIMLARSGEVKVADFGLARVQGDGGVNLTQIGVTMGTPLYMSPEQIEGRELDSRSDIYALGVTAYHMLAGEPPFTGDSPLAVAILHLNQPAPPLADRRPDVPARLAQIIDRMLAKKPDQRFRDPSALLADLHTLAQEGAEEGWAVAPERWSLSEVIQVADDRADATARLDSLMKTTSLPRVRQFPRRWLAAAIAGCLLVGGALATLFRPPSLLAGVQSAVPASDSVWGQLYQAKMVDTENAWQAVEINFPNASAFQRNLAKQGLIYHYFRTREYDKALEPLQQLADLGSTDPLFRAFGTAGLVVAHVKLDDLQAAYDENAKLTSALRTLLQQQAAPMNQLLDEALKQMF